MAQARKKVFIDAMPLASPIMSGIGHVALHTIKALERELPENYDIILVAPFNKVKLIKQHDFTRVKYYRIPLFARIIKLLNITHLLPPVDLLVGRGVYLFFNYENWPLVRSKSLTYFHDLSYALYPEFLSVKNRRYLQRFANTWLKRTTAVVTDSENTKKELVEYYAYRKPVYAVACGVDTELFHVWADNETRGLLKELGLPAKYLLYVGNLEPRKNLETLIEAYDLLPKNIKAAYSLVLVGADGWLNESLMSKVSDAQARGASIIKPPRRLDDEELSKVISCSTLLVHPALYEGFGITPLEAMACGVPVVSADNSSLPEVIGGAGLYFNAKDAGGMAKQIRAAVTDTKLRQRLVNAGRKRVRKYNWDITAQKLRAAIEEVDHA